MGQIKYEDFLKESKKLDKTPYAYRGIKVELSDNEIKYIIELCTKIVENQAKLKGIPPNFDKRILTGKMAEMVVNVFFQGRYEDYLCKEEYSSAEADRPDIPPLNLGVKGGIDGTVMIRFDHNYDEIVVSFPYKYSNGYTDYHIGIINGIIRHEDFNKYDDNLIRSNQHRSILIQRRNDKIHPYFKSAISVEYAIPLDRYPLIDKSMIF